jgi:hypothetical protein
MGVVLDAVLGVQQLGSLLAAATCWGLFFDEINKFLWWPLHLSGDLLVATFRARSRIDTYGGV